MIMEEKMMLLRRKTLGWTLLPVTVLAFVLIMSACSAPSPAAPPRSQEPAADAVPAVVDQGPAPRAGNPAPDFALVDLKGNVVRLSEMKGKVVFINFWASWCGPCRQEMPELEKIYQKYKDRGVVFLGVDIKESPALVRQFVQRGGYNWTFLLDASGAVTSRYGISAIPTSFFVDRDGVIREIYLGAMNKDRMESRLLPLLAG
ncbi:MAG: TlpA family protein disulfide reductase [Chloroflexi bacterium]|nr:TlpA family protein disulfide reductase [Chloroflexota bacterium]